VTTDNHCNLDSNARSIFRVRRAYWLIGATFLLGDGASIANAQSSTALPPVTVESPTEAPARPRGEHAPAPRPNGCCPAQRQSAAGPADADRARHRRCGSKI
jgi:iron complex outermembrane receptor protein